MFGEMFFQPGQAINTGVLNPAIGGIAGEAFLDDEMIDQPDQVVMEDAEMQSDEVQGHGLVVQERSVQDAAAVTFARTNGEEDVRPPLAKEAVSQTHLADSLLARVKTKTDRILGLGGVAAESMIHSAKILGRHVSDVVSGRTSAMTRAVVATGLSLGLCVMAAGCGMTESLAQTPAFQAFSNLLSNSEASAVMTDAFVFKLLGGLGIFLWGMHALSDNVGVILGDNITRVINWAAQKVLLGIGMGAGVTSVIQTSSGTSSIAVGMVNARKLSLESAIAILMGANIGTTVTPWLPKLPFAKWGLPVIGASILLHTVTQGRIKKESFHSGLKALGGLGMLFYGLQLMSSGFKNEIVKSFLSDMFSFLNADTTGGVLTCLGLGAAITGVVQSSSLVIMVVIPLAAAGVIDFQTAIALILGLNIGTTVTAQFSAMGKSANAKRAAHFHTMFNTVGTIPVAIAFGLYFNVFTFLLEHAGVHAPLEAEFGTHEDFLTAYEAYIGTALALFHTFFNIQNTALFVPFRKSIAALLRKVVREDESSGNLEELRTLLASIKPSDSPQVSREVIRVCVSRMAELVDMNANLLGRVWESDEVLAEVEEQLRVNEDEVIDPAQDEILEAIDEFRIPANREGPIVRELESAADKLHRVLLQIQHMRTQERPFALKSQVEARLTELHERVTTMMQDVLSILKKYCSDPNYKFDEKDFVRRILRQSYDLKDIIKGIQDEFIGGPGEDPRQQIELINAPFLEATLDLYKRFRGNLLNVAQLLAGFRDALEDEDDV